MIVFLDSCVVCSDFFFKSTSSEMLKQFLSKGNQLHISEVVIDEVKNKFREEIQNSIQKINKEYKCVNKWIETPYELISEAVIEGEANRYSNFLELFFLEHGVSVDGYPSVSHKDIVQRAIQRKKPFKEDGKDGYRDFLIWTALINVAKRHSVETLCFISSNVKDFSDANSKNDLHQDLILDLAENNIERDKVQFFISLKDFVEKVVKTELQKIDEQEAFITQLLDPNAKFLPQFKDILSTQLNGFDISGYGLDISDESPTISGIDDISSVEVIEATEMSSNEILLEIKATVLCNVDFFIHKSDLAIMDDLSGISVVDSDWNNHYVLAETHMEIDVYSDVIFSNEINTLEITNLENPYDDCIYCN